MSSKVHLDEPSSSNLPLLVMGPWLSGEVSSAVLRANSDLAASYAHGVSMHGDCSVSVHSYCRVECQYTQIWMIVFASPPLGDVESRPRTTKAELRPQQRQTTVHVSQTLQESHHHYTTTRQFTDARHQGQPMRGPWPVPLSELLPLAGIYKTSEAVVMRCPCS